MGLPSPHLHHVTFDLIYSTDVNRQDLSRSIEFHMWQLSAFCHEVSEERDSCFARKSRRNAQKEGQDKIKEGKSLFSSSDHISQRHECIHTIQTSSSVRLRLTFSVFLKLDFSLLNKTKIRKFETRIH